MHVSEHNIVAADGSCGIGIRIAWGFVVGVPLSSQKLSKKGLYSIGPDREGADDGDLELRTSDWA